MDLLSRTTWALVCVTLGLQLGCGEGTGPERPRPSPVDADGDGHLANLDCDDQDASVWWVAKGYLDVDGDGRGDPALPVTCVGDDTTGWTTVSDDCAPQDPTRWRSVPGLYPDQDGDGATGPGPVTACVGSTLAGYREQLGEPDCDDQDAEVWRSELAWADTDGDGVGGDVFKRWCPGKGRTPPAGHVTTTGDCAPGDASQWQLQAFSHRDEDGDGFTRPLTGVVCSGTELPPGFASTPAQPDCDDRAPNRTTLVERWADLDVDGFGHGTPVLRCQSPWESLPWETFRDGDCAPEDGQRWQLLAYASRDVDGDVFLAPETGQVCSGFWLPVGYSDKVLNQDCDDRDASRFRVWNVHADTDGDGVGAGPVAAVCGAWGVPAGHSVTDTDCEAGDASRWRLLSYAFRDADGDRYTVAQSGALCGGASLPQGYSTQVGWGLDCDDTNAAANHNVSAYADTDGDGVGAGAATTLCTAGQVPAPWSATSTDCAAEDVTRWQSLAASHVDADGDGFTTPIPATPVCTGQTLPLPYHPKAVGNDCNDAEPGLFRWAVLYPDKDGDGVGAPPRQVECIGQTVPAGLSLYGDDDNDQDPGQQVDEEQFEDLELILDL
ncbi:hypothetical protein [Corallococcus sicarius]|uniref:Uncharacterized protein n=1 Tax=Corallococcus sicarius TaxID=2316726 RepID=A0A3A8N8G7_9BACT|nr:hypothetical protein [Corallococcus sicarius]RKH39730.1 hypothetical protein D7X12_22855 [Corallococcus sicarius]